MADDNAAELLKRSEARFSKRASLDALRQEIALNFAPHLAEWTSPLQWGADYAAHLADSTPLLLAREFVGQVGAMLRPEGKQWFWHRHADSEVNNNREARDYLDWRSGQMMRIMTDRMTGFMGACQQADTFFSLFGDAVLSVDTCDKRETLRIDSYHTKDCAWAIGPEKTPDTITRRETVAARVLKSRFSQPIDKLHDKVHEACEKDGEETVDIRHEVLPAREYDAYVRKKGKAARDKGWWSVWVDATNRAIIREVWQPTFRYVIPGWVRLTGSPYAMSPATMIALPDARLIQQQAVAIMEAAERQLTPPLVATRDAIRGDVRLNGITWVDAKYDERMGDPLRALELGKNFNIGIESLARTEAQLMRAFYLDRLRMPDTRNSKSVVEVQFLIDEFIRSALPLFAPMQVDYNDRMLAEIDGLIQVMGGYDARPVPKLLQDTMKHGFFFAWNNPLSDMMERQKAQMVSEIGGVANAVAALEAAAAQAPALQQTDTAKMYRETVMGLGGSGWLLSERVAKDNAATGAQANQMREMIAAAPGIASVIKSGTEAAVAAGQIPQAAEPAYPLLPAPL